MVFLGHEQAPSPQQKTVVQYSVSALCLGTSLTQTDIIFPLTNLQALMQVGTLAQSIYH